MERFDSDFIKRCECFVKPAVDEYLDRRRQKINKWNKDNPEKLKESQKKYFKSLKGRLARFKVNCIRRSKFKHWRNNLTKLEKKAIILIYASRPPGYEVDHIIPISKGGPHHPSNLRVITRQENRKKSAKMPILCEI